MASLSGDGIRVSFDALLTERISRGGKITSSPIEGNTTVNDHFAKNPNTIAITGVCTRRSANKLANLNRLFNDVVICRYSGMNGVRNVVITRLDTDHGGDLGKGFQFNMTLSVVTISYTQEFTSSTSLTNGANSAQVQQQTNIGANSPSERIVDTITAVAANTNAATLIRIY